MARIDNNKKLNDFISSEENFDFVLPDDPRYPAVMNLIAAANRKRSVRIDANRAIHRENAENAAAGFSVGQIVRHGKRAFDREGKVEGEVVLIDGENVVIRRDNGKEQKFIASALVAA